MEITRTINCDRRYYLDENQIQNPDSLVDTICRFNDMKIRLYNCLYDRSFLRKGPLMDRTYSQWMKDIFHTNDYYNCAVYRAASGVLSSQKELKSLYIKTKQADLKAREEKIRLVCSDLEKKRSVKESIRTYILSGRWKKPYLKCVIRPAGKSICLPGGKKIPISEYERTVEDSIRKLKSRIAQLAAAKERAVKKLQDLESFPPRRVLFGTMERYKQKDLEKTDRNAWKEAFRQARHASMSLPGRHTSKDCNFLVRKAGQSLVIRCMDGKEAVLEGFHLARYHDVWLGMLQAKKGARKAVCYNFQIHKDRNGRLYLIVSVTLTLANPYCNESFVDGCVSIDLNYDHVAVSDLDRDGNRIGGQVLHFDPEDSSSGQMTETIGRIMAVVGKYCADRKKPLVMEDLDTTIARHGMRYGNARGNRHASIFAYRKMTACLENQSYKQSFGILKIDPAYTSQMGKFLYMRKMGLSIHEAASYTIGLKGMGLRERMLPDGRLIDLLPEKEKSAALNGKDMDSLMHAWRKIIDAFRGVPVHSFYREIPYSALEGKIRVSLKTVSSEMKTWTETFVC